MSGWSDDAPLFVRCVGAAERQRHWVPPPPPYDPETPIILSDLATLRRALDRLNQL